MSNDITKMRCDDNTNNNNGLIMAPAHNDTPGRQRKSLTKARVSIPLCHQVWFGL